jgi:hypothetical protein
MKENSPPDQRTSRRQLEALDSTITSRDQAVLTTLADCRYATTGQLVRLIFTGNINPSAATRAANRALNKLQRLELITSLNRRIGGVRAGSSGFVWSLTSAGFRLLNLDGEAPRKRNFEPSPRFAEHTVAVTELFVQLNGMVGIALAEVQFEPKCWRGQLKPDLYAITSDGEYDDHWFFELDLATEAPTRIVSKCEQYEEYYRSGAESVFPLVVWVTPTAKRKVSIRQHIADSRELRHKHIFTVVQPEELEDFIRKGAGQ